jgi:hypothetical protein
MAQEKPPRFTLQSTLSFLQELHMLGIKHLQLQFVTDSAGRRSAVILPIEQFYELLEGLEDLAVTAERRDEPTISHQQVTDELAADGILSN